MLDVLEFIFSSFWIFIGVVILLIVIFAGIVDIIKAFKKPKYFIELTEDQLNTLNKVLSIYDDM